MMSIATPGPPSVGDEVFRHTRLVTQSDIDRYAYASGDMNPLHVDHAFAAGTSFGSTIAHGHLILAYMMQALVDAVGGSMGKGVEVDVSFVRPVLSDSQILILGFVADVAVENGATFVSLNVEAHVEAGIAVSGHSRIEWKANE